MNKVALTKNIIYNENVKEDITIVHISDIHFNKTTKKEKLIKLGNYIKKIKPDYIMITGDTVDKPIITKNSTKIKELINFLTTIAEESKVIISLGNHDIQVEEDYRFFEKLNDLYNIYFLNNTSYQDKNIYVFGLTLPTSYYYNIDGGEAPEVLLYELNKYEKEIIKAPKNTPKIAMIHSPIKLTNHEVLNKLKNFDIVLSGHTHNGMIHDGIGNIIKGNFGIVSPRKGLFPSVARGRIDKKVGTKTLTIIINGAVTKLSLSAGTIMNKLNCVYRMSVNKIIIRKKRGI